jgi:CTP:molybdopterin cytidylyltransferase MocA
MPVAAIVLAAGASRRLGQPKQLLPHNGETLLERAMRLAQEAGASPLLVVLGANAPLIRAAVPFENVLAVENADWEQGIASSIHAGLRELEAIAPDASGALILGCDQPRLSAAHLRALLRAFEEQESQAIAASTYAGVLGIPAAFPRTVFPFLLALRGDRGARALLAAPPCSLLAVEFAGGEMDIDLPADLAELE